MLWTFFLEKSKINWRLALRGQLDNTLYLLLISDTLLSHVTFGDIVLYNPPPCDRIVLILQKNIAFSWVFGEIFSLKNGQKWHETF